MLTVTNNLAETLQISAVEVAAPFSVVLPSQLPIPVNAGDFVTLTVRFTPTAVGLRTAKVTLRELSGETLLVVDLSGFGIPNQPPPVISSFSPTTVLFGDPVTISGQYFTQTTSVKIGNTLVNFDVLSDTQISIDAEATNGRITVVTLFGTVTSSGTLRVIFPRPGDP